MPLICLLDRTTFVLFLRIRRPTWIVSLQLKIVFYESFLLALAIWISLNEKFDATWVSLVIELVLADFKCGWGSEIGFLRHARGVSAEAISKEIETAVLALLKSRWSTRGARFTYRALSTVVTFSRYQYQLRIVTALNQLWAIFVTISLHIGWSLHALLFNHLSL